MKEKQSSISRIEQAAFEKKRMNLGGSQLHNFGDRVGGRGKGGEGEKA